MNENKENCFIVCYESSFGRIHPHKVFMKREKAEAFKKEKEIEDKDVIASFKRYYSIEEVPIYFD